MDYREKEFIEKFKNAAHHLNVKPNEIVSMKFREMVNSYSEYHHLLETLERELGISYQKLKDNFQGTGYLLTDSHSKVIIVEHETGLEILYIAGSIASLIGLVPYVIKGWNIMRGFNNSRHYSRDLRNIEIRKLDDAGHLKEDHVHETIMHEDAFLPNSAFISATQNLESEILKLRKAMKSLTNRIKTIEKNNSKINSKRTIKKTETKQKRK
jgi:hypothetical protein